MNWRWNEYEQRGEFRIDMIHSNHRAKISNQMLIVPEVKLSFNYVVLIRFKWFLKWLQDSCSCSYVCGITIIARSGLLGLGRYFYLRFIPQDSRKPITTTPGLKLGDENWAIEERLIYASLHKPSMSCFDWSNSFSRACGSVDYGIRVFKLLSCLGTNTQTREVTR